MALEDRRVPGPAAEVRHRRLVEVVGPEALHQHEDDVGLALEADRLRRHAPHRLAGGPEEIGRIGELLAAELGEELVHPDRDLERQHRPGGVERLAAEEGAGGVADPIADGEEQHQREPADDAALAGVAPEEPPAHRHLQGHEQRRDPGEPRQLPRRDPGLLEGVGLERHLEEEAVEVERGGVVEEGVGGEDHRAGAEEERREPGVVAGPGEGQGEEEEQRGEEHRLDPAAEPEERLDPRRKRLQRPGEIGPEEGEE